MSKYRERRRETELRLKDTRENLLRLDDIKQELVKQLEHLTAQAEVATRYHELQGRLNATQNLLWFLRKQEAAALRARYGKDTERLGLDLEAETARLREAGAAARRDTRRALPGERRGACRTGASLRRTQQPPVSSRRLPTFERTGNAFERELAQLAAQLEAGPRAADGGRRQSGTGAESLRLPWSSPRRAKAWRRARAKSCRWRRSVSRHRNRYDELQRALAQTDQALQIEHTKRAHAQQLLDQLAQRAERLREEAEHCRRRLRPGSRA